MRRKTSLKVKNTSERERWYEIKGILRNNLLRNLREDSEFLWRFRVYESNKSHAMIYQPDGPPLAVIYSDRIEGLSGNFPDRGTYFELKRYIVVNARLKNKGKE